jgi:NAD(P)H-dependent FMN reductase
VSPRILVIAGSIRTGSFNARLAALGAKELTAPKPPSAWCRSGNDLRDPQLAGLLKTVALRLSEMTRLFR